MLFEADISDSIFYVSRHDYIYMYMYIYICMYMDVCVYIDILHIHIHVCIYIYIHTYIYTYIYTHIYIYVSKVEHWKGDKGVCQFADVARAQSQEDSFRAIWHLFWDFPDQCVKCEMDFSLLECFLCNAFICLDRFRWLLLKMLPETKVFRFQPWLHASQGAHGDYGTFWTVSTQYVCHVYGQVIPALHEPSGAVVRLRGMT